MRHVSFGMVQAPCTAIAGRRCVVAHGHLLHEIQIIRALRGWDDPMPDPRNHALLPVSGLCFAVRRIAVRLRSTSDSAVAHEETLIRIAFLPFHTVPPHQHVPSSWISRMTLSVTESCPKESITLLSTTSFRTSYPASRNPSANLAA